MYQYKNFEETPASQNVDRLNNNPQSKKRKPVDQDSGDIKDLNTKRPHLDFPTSSDSKMMIEDSKNFGESFAETKDELYDVLCEYLNILIPGLKWQTNTAEIPTRYEVVDLTQQQAKILANQLALVLKQAIVSIEQIQEQNYRVLLSGVNIKYLQEMSNHLHKNRIWIPENISVEDFKVPRLGSMFGYPSLAAYLKALKSLGMNQSQSMKKIESEWDLLKPYDAEEERRKLREWYDSLAGLMVEHSKEIKGNAVIKDIIEVVSHITLKMAILNERVKGKKIKDCLLKYTCQGNYWLFQWYFRANNYRIDKNLLLCAAASNNIEIVRDVIAYGPIGMFSVTGRS